MSRKDDKFENQKSIQSLHVSEGGGFALDTKVHDTFWWFSFGISVKYLISLVIPHPFPVNHTPFGDLLIKASRYPVTRSRIKASLNMTAGLLHTEMDWIILLQKCKTTFWMYCYLQAMPKNHILTPKLGHLICLMQ